MHASAEDCHALALRLLDAADEGHRLPVSEVREALGQRRVVELLDRELGLRLGWDDGRVREVNVALAELFPQAEARAGRYGIRDDGVCLLAAYALEGMRAGRAGPHPASVRDP